MERKPIHDVLADVMCDVRAVGKNDRNTAQGFDFRGVDAVVNAVGPVLRNHRVAIVPHTSEARYRDVKTSTGKPARECVVLVTYRIHGPAGDHMDVQVPGESLDAGDKGTAKAMSVAYRTALIQTLCLPTCERDPDHDSYERGQSLEDEAETIRAEIRTAADARDISLYDVMADFKQRMQVDIRRAAPELLTAYLKDLRANGIRREVSA